MSKPFTAAEESGYYLTTRPVSGDEILSMALGLIKRKFTRGKALTSPDASRDFLILKLAELEHECFCCLYLDNQHRVLQFESLFRGTIDGASVYPREVVKRALALNASAIIFAHNHPSGTADPSEADKFITQRLKQALGLLDIRVLDHFIVGGAEVMSFAEKGLL
ncbi:MAG: DNA repair protein [Candidatus Methylumidiphilus alinenensis]|uniref:DNA repair protein n=1 Tax=Candidatus Methylumidiphilus alinenensis TaxID=2202197 RepID=A0A2W4QTG7_9GAMM|nr:MAG: DNA repair protein [Candidatus Methylumidiphilus alinenensis]